MFVPVWLSIATLLSFLILLAILVHVVKINRPFKSLRTYGQNLEFCNTWHTGSGPAIVVMAEDFLYPQYDGRISMFVVTQREYLKKKVEKKVQELAAEMDPKYKPSVEELMAAWIMGVDRIGVHPDVGARWKAILDGSFFTELEGKIS